MTRAPRIDELCADVRAAGLAWRGAFHPLPADGVPAFDDGCPVATLALVGFVGGAQWAAFAASPERSDGDQHPLDRWSRRLVDGIAARRGAVGLYPSDGPPWLPFQRWAMRAEAVHVSPLGILIHPDWGLWHAYRGALAWRDRLDLPPPDRRPSPCTTCVGRPCLSTCPVQAVAPGRYDHAACTAHVAGAPGIDCLELACRARRSCPAGAAHRYGRDQAEFHMRAFLGPG